MKRITASLFSLLTACAVPFPFMQSSVLKDYSKNENVIVSITEAYLNADSNKNKIFRQNTIAVVSNLKNEEGYLGHAVRIGLLGDRAWTMTVWKDEASLKKFIYGKTHKMAMSQGTVALKSARFATVMLKRQEIPISWSKALTILDQQGYPLNKK